MNIKKLLSVIVVIALVVTTVSFTPSIAEAKAKKKYVKSIKVTKTLTITKGKTKTIKVKVKVKGKVSKKFSAFIKNSNVASVSKKGKKIVIRANRIGVTKISVVSKGKTKYGKKLKKYITVKVVDAKKKSNGGKPRAEEVPAATKYYKNNSKLLSTIDADDSDDVFSESNIVSFLENKGFGGNEITFDTSIYGDYIDKTEIDDGSNELHPMYQTHYISKNGDAWAIYVINGDIFANPISFNFNSDLEAQLLFSESNTLTSYDDETNQFYVSIPYASAVVVRNVGEINSETLDSLTIKEICRLTGADYSKFLNEDDEQDEDQNKSDTLFNSYDSKNKNVKSTEFGYSAQNPLVVVSLGDSYSSGEGIEPFYFQSDDLNSKVGNNDWLAHRSQNSWPSLLKVPGIDGTMGNYKVGLSETSNAKCQWYFAASSGAETTHFWNEQLKKYDITTGLFSERVKGSKYLPSQISAFGGKKGEVDYVTLTLGGNDVGFADIVMTCALDSTYLHFGSTSKIENQLNNTWKYFDNTSENIREVYEGIKSAAGVQASIIVAGYPQLFSPDGKGFVISKKEANLVNSNVTKFNKKIKNIVKDCYDEGMDISFVDVETEFSGHQAYSNSPWINKIIPEKRSQDLDNHKFGSAYSMHPNAKGAQAYARLVSEKIEEIENRKANQLRIVLSWGDEPNDLDSHLVGPTANGGKFHVYYSNKSYDNDVALDVDDINGYGRETTVVRNVRPGIYTYAVHNYSNRWDDYSNTMSLSEGRVRVYRGESLLATYNVPSGEGTLWTVFSYDSSTNQITPINNLSYEGSSSDVLSGVPIKSGKLLNKNDEIDLAKKMIINDINKSEK